MDLAISTHWNAARHASGEAMLEQILELGFKRVELGYDLTADLVPGVRRMVESGAVRVGSLHGICPVPLISPYAHPEIFTLVNSDRRTRAAAVRYTIETVQFAAAMGAATVVVHAGYVGMSRLTADLISMYEEGRQHDRRYERTRMKLLVRRQRKAERFLAYLFDAIEQLLPALEENRVRLAFENLPSWEAVPSEAEMARVAETVDSPWIAYWHDIGHAQTRQNLGLISQVAWLSKLAPYLAGFHVHDVVAPARDHLMPPHGEVDFGLFKAYLRDDIELVLEPAPGTDAEDIRRGAAFIRDAWEVA